jgi:hypothetical protein
MNNLRQLGIAISEYAQIHSCFPSAGLNTPWPVGVAPHLEQHWLFSAYDRRQPCDSPGNAPLGEHRIRVFECPAQREVRVSPKNWLTGNYAINVELAGQSPSVCTDGLAFTGLCTEITSEQQVPWITGPALVFGPQDMLHGNVLHVLRADGSVLTLPKESTDVLMTPLGTPSGGEVVNLPL